MTASDVDVSVDWDAEKTFAAELEFEQLIKLSSRTRNFWDWVNWRHKCRDEAGRCGVVELGFNADKRPYRVLAMFHGSMRIVVLCICYHKGQVWTPKDAIEIATSRAKRVLAGKAKLNVIKITDDL